MSQNQQKSNEDHGELTDVSLKNGPIENRSCTDVFCCLVFIVFVASTLALTSYASTMGNTKLLLTPFDPDHRACGVDNAVANFPFIYFTNPTSSSNLYQTVCVSECPDGTKNVLSCAPNSVVGSCSGTLITSAIAMAAEDMKQGRHVPLRLARQVRFVEGLNKNKSSKKLELAAVATPVLVYKSTPFGKVCLPQVTSYYNTMTSALPQGFSTAIKDIQATYPVILGSAGIALAIGLFFMLLVRYMAGVVVWTFILAIVAIFFIAGGVCYAQYSNLSIPTGTAATNAAVQTAQSILNKAQAANFTPQQWQGLAITSFFLGILAILVLLFLASKIKLAVGIMKTAALFVADNISSLLLPIVVFVVCFLYLLYWIGVSLMLYSIGTVSTAPQQLPFAQFQPSDQARNLFLYHIFSGLWITAFIMAASDFILVCSTAIWYFKRGSGQLRFLDSPIRVSFGYLFYYHLGTVAFGSLVLAVVWTIQLLLEFLNYTAKKAGQSENAAFKLFIAITRCCLACFERFIQFLNKNAYTITAMTSKGFWNSAQESFFLMLRNAARFTVAGGIGDIFVILGKIFITGITALIGYSIITQYPVYSQNLTSPVVPTVLMAIIGFIIGSIFMSVYGTVSDAILVVFTMDEEIEKKSGKGDPANCPEPLKEFISNL